MVIPQQLVRALGCSLLLATAALPVRSAAASVTATHAHAPLRIALVLDIGGRNDKSFNQLAYQGALTAQKQYGIQFDYVETPKLANQLYYQEMNGYATKHYDLIIGIGFLMAQAMYKVALQYPHQKFALVDSAPADAKGISATLPNVANLFFKEQESGYLVGYMAGLLEKSHVGIARHNVIGVMGGIAIPPVNHYIAGYIQGARIADPGIKIKLAYSGDFSDINKGLTIGRQQVAAGADILFAVAGSAGLGYLKAAQERHLYGIGVDADQAYLGPYMLTSAVKKVDEAVALTIGSVKDGKFKGGDQTFSLANNATGYGKVASFVPKNIQDQVAAQAKLIATGQLVPRSIIPRNL